MRKSEQAVLLIGTINVTLLLIASSLSSTGFDSGMLILILVHIIIIIGAFPILYRAIVGSYTSSKVFSLIFSGIAILSALLIILTGILDVSDVDDPYFYILGTIELIPLFWIYIKKRHIIWQPTKKLPFDLN